MSMLRRASVHLKNRGISSGTRRICWTRSEILTGNVGNRSAGIDGSQEKLLDKLLPSTKYFNTSSTSKKFAEVHSFSSQAGPENNGEDDDDLDDGFSDLEIPHGSVQEAVSGDEHTDESVSESELSEDVDVMRNVLDDLSDSKGKKSFKRKDTLEMTKIILASPALPVKAILDKWVGEGNEVNQIDALLCLLQLRKRKLFLKALQLSQWLENTKCFDFLEGNYASRLDLIARVHGLSRAESYLQKIPESFRGELVYRTLLASCVRAINIKKAEDLFKKMKDLGFPMTSFSFDQLLLLYKKTNKKKIEDILVLMEKEDVKPSRLTYQILIDVKGQSKDTSGMEQILQSMKNEEVKPTTQLLASVSQHYVAAGLKDKAEAILREMEGDDITKNKWACRWILPIYASLGRGDEVARIWKACESDPRLGDCIAAIEAFGKLKDFENAEAAFEKMARRTITSFVHFTALLKVYANHKMLEKGKDLVKRIAETGRKIESVTWDGVVKFYVDIGEVEKADSLVEKIVQKKLARPRFTSFFAIMDQYAKRGDVHKTEKLFHQIRQAGYFASQLQYRVLLTAYENAKAPVYGFNERMKAGNIVPNEALIRKFASIDPFKKNRVSAILPE